MTNHTPEMISSQRGPTYPVRVAGQTTWSNPEPVTWATFVHRRRQARLQRKLFQTMVTAMSAG